MLVLVMFCGRGWYMSCCCIHANIHGVSKGILIPHISLRAKFDILRYHGVEDGNEESGDRRAWDDMRQESVGRGGQADPKSRKRGVRDVFVMCLNSESRQV